MMVQFFGHRNRAGRPSERRRTDDEYVAVDAAGSATYAPLDH